MNRRRAVVLTAPLAVAAALLTGCDDDGPLAGQSGEAPGGSPASSGDADGVVVQALDNFFRAEAVTVEAGTEIRWDNVGRHEHDVIPVDPESGWGVEPEDFAPGDTYSHVFTEHGEYAYYCSLHGTETAGMVGTIVVTGD